MKRMFKKVITSITASVLCAVPLVQSSMPIGAYHANQQHTWRFLEKTSKTGLTSYESTLVYDTTLGYNLLDCKAGNAIPASGGFSHQEFSSFAVLMSYSSINTTAGAGYLSNTTITTPLNVNQESVFLSNLNYDVTYANGATITKEAVLVGDVNKDGYVNTEDSKIVANYIIGKQSLTSSQRIAADVNNDGNIDLHDCIKLEEFSDGNINYFTPVKD